MIKYLTRDPLIAELFEEHKAGIELDTNDIAFLFLKLHAFEEIQWKSIDKDNMEYQATITCWQMDKIR